MKTTLTIVTALIIGIVAGYWVTYHQSHTTTPTASSLVNGTLLPADFRTMPEIALVDQHGQTFTRQQLTGHWSLLFLGYTHCPDVCPNTLAVLNQMYTALPHKDRLQVIFISVDPKRDTPELLDTYIRYFNQNFIAVTGDDNTLNPLVRTLGAVYHIDTTQATASDYLVDHSASLFLLDPNANLRAYFPAPHHTQDLLQDINTILQQNG